MQEQEYIIRLNGKPVVIKVHEKKDNRYRATNLSSGRTLSVGERRLNNPVRSNWITNHLVGKG